MKEDARFRNAEKRKAEFEDKMKAKAARKREREDAKRPVVTLSRPEEEAAALSSGAASSGLPNDCRREDDVEMPSQERGGGQEKRERSWEELADNVKRRTQGVKESTEAAQENMDVAKVEKLLEEQSWEEVVDANTEDQMIAEIEMHGADDELEEEMDEVHAGGWAWDDVKNKPLDVGKVREARLEEVGYMIRKGIWKEVDIQECWDRTGREPVTVKWVDTDKGEDGHVAIRSRLVARDFRTKGEKDREDLFAATPPLELLRMMISRTATITGDEERRKMLFVDVKKAHLNPVRSGRLLLDPGGGESAEGQVWEAGALAVRVQTGSPGVGEPVCTEDGGSRLREGKGGISGVLARGAARRVCGPRGRFHLQRCRQGPDVG